MTQQNKQSRAPLSEQEKQEMMLRRKARLSAERGEAPQRPLTPEQKKRIQKQRAVAQKMRQKQQKQAAKAEKKAQKQQLARRKRAAKAGRANEQPQENIPRPGSRFAARRARRKRTIIAVSLLIAFIVVGAVLSVTVLFKIDTYRIDGESPYPEQQLIAAFGHNMGENMFRFSLSKAEESMRAALPYLEMVKVRRRLPGTVVFIVSPATEYAALDNGDGTQLLLSDTLRVLDLASQPKTNLLQVSGFTPVEPQPGAFVQSEDAVQDEHLSALVDAVKNSGITGLTRIDLSDEYELTAVYADRMTIKLGTASQLEYKLSVVKKTLESGAEQGLFTDSTTGTLDASTAGTVYYRP